MSPIRESRKVMLQLTEAGAERNIYVHPNPIGRDIFWQRLEILADGLKKHSQGKDNVIDFGGGSGGFLRGLCGIFRKVEVIDLDPEDARRVKEHYKLDNAVITTGNIDEWKPAEPRQVVIATDVLEHFKDMDHPIKRIRTYLAPKGLLAISVPTENWIYRFGRILINKTKPADHYHAGGDIVKRVQELGFKLVWKADAPQYGGFSIPLFHLAIFEKID